MKRSHRSTLAAAVLSTMALSSSGCGGSAGIPAVAGFDGSPVFNQSLTRPGNEPAGEFRSDGTSSRRIAILFKGGITSTTLTSLQSRYRILFERQIPQIGAASAVIPADSSPEAVIARMKADPSILNVESVHRATLDGVGREDFQVNDPLFSQQYALERVQATKAWEVTQGLPEVKIAVVDTGVDLTHPDLKEKLLPGHNVFDKDQPPLDDYGHGTHVAGIVGAVVNNGIGVAGLAAKCSIVPVKVLKDGYGDDVSISAGIVWAADNGVDVINTSLRIGPKSEVAEKAIQYALNKNVVFVASAGNESRMIDPVKAPRLPATFPGVIAVVASDAQDRKAGFSNYGPAASVAAPGDGILSTYPLNRSGDTPGYTTMSGTSMAAPLVAGLAGLVRSQMKGASPAQVKQRLETTTDKIGQTGFDPNGLAWGRVNAFKAVQGTVLFGRR